MQADQTRRKTEKPNVVPRPIGLAALALFFSLLLLRPFTAGSAEYLTVSGCSVSNVGYLSALASEYERRTGVKVFVRGGGSVVGIEDLRSGKVDFAASCRPPEADDPPGVTFVPVAWDALAFIVHKSNPVNSISLDDARSIYGGGITNWHQLKGRYAPIKIYFCKTKKGLSGVESSLKKLVLNGKEPVETADVVSVASTGIVEQMVEQNPEAFAVTGITSARKRNVKVLRLNGVAPTTRAIIEKRYPLRRPLFLLLPKNPRPEVRKFVDFALSREGQRFIRSQHVVSLLDMP